MHSMLITSLLSFAAASGAAELESKVDEPYRLTVCLGFSDDPMFTPFFTASVGRQVRDQLANYFGELVELEVVSEHALLDSAARGGLPELAVSPEQLDEHGVDDKLLLAAIDFDAGLYRVEWRQLDGQMGRIGPARSRTTPDRQWLAKAISLAIKEDFAPVARVLPRSGRAQVELEFQGSGLGRRLADLLADGCVLEPYWVIRQKGGELARVPIPYAVLRLAPGGNLTKASVVSSLPDPWRRTARVAGFQAIKLSTCTGRFRLRLVDARSGSPVQSCQVYANSHGFDEIGDQDRLDPPDRHGYVIAPRPFDHLAYVEIAQTGGSISRILLPITDTWCEQVCKLRVEEHGAEKGDFQRQVTVLVQDVQVLESMLDQRVRQLNQLNENKQYEEALQQLRAAVRTVGPLVQTAGRDVVRLQAQAAELEIDSDKRLAWAAEQVGEVGGRVADLREMDGKLEKTIEQTIALNLATVQARLAEDLVKQGDVDQAIANYREAVRLSPQAEFQQRLDELQATWEIKDNDHRAARSFVFEIWPKTSITRLDEVQPEAERAFGKLEQVDDYLTARRLLKTTGEHLRELSDLVDMLSQRNTEADREQCEEYIELTDRMARFQLDVGAYLKDRLEKPPEADAAPPKEHPDQKPAAAKQDRPAEAPVLEEERGRRASGRLTRNRRQK
jgi:tetratricopeptide (TPR) repeat protein